VKKLKIKNVVAIEYVTIRTFLFFSPKNSRTKWTKKVGIKIAPRCRNLPQSVVGS